MQDDGTACSSSAASTPGHPSAHLRIPSRRMSVPVDRQSSEAQYSDSNSKVRQCLDFWICYIELSHIEQVTSAKPLPISICQIS